RAAVVIASIIASALSTVTINTHAILIDSDLTCYEEYYRFNDRMAIYRSVNENGNSVLEYLVPYYYMDVLDGYAPMVLSCNKYYQITESEIVLLDNYLAEYYPAITLETANSSARLIYDKEYTFEEELDIAIDIYEDTGLGFIIGIYEGGGLYDLKLLGDTDSDGAVNALDASNILTYYASGQTGSLSTYSDEDIDSMTLVGDYDGDGNVNAVDASLVLAEYAEEQTKGT
ncbi:MAG: hypothetical protein IJ421_11215, partial [Prevotella sp.]|nr:hypothetical protein [Prevotella sp.]